MMKPWDTQTQQQTVRISMVRQLVGTALLVGAVQWVSTRPLQAEETPKPAAPPPDNTLEWVKVAISGAGTLATIVGGVFVFWNVRLTASRLITERFSKAVEQLGSDKIEVRLGGIYALERIAQDSKRDHWTIMEVLTAFVREKSPLEAPKTSVPKTFVAAALEVPASEAELPPVMAKDVQAALTVIGRRRYKYDPEGKRLDLSSINLSGANLINANLESANFSGAILERARLGFANLRFANLRFANLRFANLVDTNLYCADLFKTNLRRAYLRESHFESAQLNYANLSGTDLTYADLDWAELRRANLISANLSGAKGLTDYQLSFAILCHTTLSDGTISDRDCEAMGFPSPNSPPSPEPPPESPPPPPAPDA